MEATRIYRTDEDGNQTALSKFLPRRGSPLVGTPAAVLDTSEKRFVGLAGIHSVWLSQNGVEEISVEHTALEHYKTLGFRGYVKGTFRDTIIFLTCLRIATIQKAGSSVISSSCYFGLSSFNLSREHSRRPIKSLLSILATTLSSSLGRLRLRLD